jgi:hypothetical protein
MSKPFGFGIRGARHPAGRAEDDPPRPRDPELAGRGRRVRASRAAGRFEPRPGRGAEACAGIRSRAGRRNEAATAASATERRPGPMNELAPRGRVAGPIQDHARARDSGPCPGARLAPPSLRATRAGRSCPPPSRARREGFGSPDEDVARAVERRRGPPDPRRRAPAGIADPAASVREPGLRLRSLLGQQHGSWAQALGPDAITR